MTHTPNQPQQPSANNEVNEEPADVGYANRWFIQGLFPYKKTTETIQETGEKRDVRQRAITLQRDMLLFTSPLGLPYGKYPRYIIAYLTTVAKQQQSLEQQGIISNEEARTVLLGTSFNSFIKQMGIQFTWGSRQKTLFLKQLERLITSQVLVTRLWSKDGKTHKDLEPENLGSLHYWTNEIDPNGNAVEGKIVLSEYFYGILTESPFPIDLTIHRKISGARALDIYMWLTLKQAWLSKTGYESYTFSWEQLAQNFCFKPLKKSYQWSHFRQDVRLSVQEVTEVWPNAGAEITKEGLKLTKTAPSVPPKA